MSDKIKNEDEKSEGDMYESFSVKVDTGQAPLRIDKFLMGRMTNTTRNRIQNGVKNGTVLVNNKPVKSNYKVRPLDEISVLLAEPPADHSIIVGEEMDLDIRYEDDSLLVIHKPAGLVVHPGVSNWSGTMANGLKFHFDNLPIMQGNSLDRPGLVHRIDKDTSGLLVIAKTKTAMTHLAKQFFDHSIERKYEALVWGNFDEPTGTIDEYIGRDPRDRMLMSVSVDGEYGRPAITHYKVLEDLYYVSRIEVQLETGRTHQIRTHMKHLNHPIFSDARYGGDKIVKGTVFSKYRQFVQNCFKIIPRQALHAKSLGFIHPDTNEFMKFEADLPDDFQQVMEKWRNYLNTRKDGIF